MNFLKVFLILLVSTLANSVFAKPLPPGTGSSVPANILFLVDKSQSMWDPASGDKRKYVRPFIDVEPRGDGNYFTVSVDDSGFGYWNPDTNNLSNSNGVFGGQATSRGSRIFGYQDANLAKPINMQYRGNFLYVLQDKSLTKAPGYTLMSIDSTKKDEGKKAFANCKVGKKGKPSKNCSSTTKAITRFYTRSQAGSINPGLKDGGKKAKRDTAGNEAIYFIKKPSMDIHGNKMWAISEDTWRVITLNGHLDKAATKICYPSSSILKKFNEAIDVVTESGKTYIYSKHGANGLILKQELKSDGCPTGSLYQSWNKSSNYDKCGSGKGQSIAVQNRVIYTTGFLSAQVCRYSQSGSSISLTHKIGSKDAYTQNSASNSAIYLDKPMGIKIGEGTNETTRVYVANFGRNEVTILRNNNLTYIDHFGDSGVSLWKGAEDSISFVARDSSLSQSANFGVGFWQGGSANFTGFAPNSINPKFDAPLSNEGNTPEGNIAVGINPKGSQQILELFAQEKVNLQYGTKGLGLKTLMNKYWTYDKGIVNPIIPGLDCQVNAMIIIGDGKFDKGSERDPKSAASARLNQQGVLTFTVGYGQTVTQSASAKQMYKDIAIAGGTHKESGGSVKQQGFFTANTPADLKAVIDQIVQTIVAKTYSYSAPSISSEIARTGQLFQGKFQNRKNKEWWGTILKTELTEKGNALASKQVWDLNDKIKLPAQRKIWTAVKGNTTSNNFTEANVATISNYALATGNLVKDYHRKTVGSNNLTSLTRCKNASGVLDGINDEYTGLIRFVRGEDYFDYDGDCDLRETRKRKDDNGNLKNAYVADIYNSELAIVGKPSASIQAETKNTESYFRQENNYVTFASNNIKRKDIIFAAANNGVLHAVDAVTGDEVWGFVPPLVIPKLPRVINPSLNQASGGGSIPLFLLDGSPVIHDTYFKHPITKREDWYTLLMIPYGRAGAGFSTIDVTDPNNPLHLYSILNDSTSQKILRVDHESELFTYSYPTTRLNITQFNQSITAENNQGGSTACNNSGATSCYKSKTWTVPNILDISKDYTIFANGIDVTSSTTATNTSGEVKLIFNKEYRYDASGNTSSDNISIVQIGELSSGGEEYDYRYLGETWGSPRVFRMPNEGAGDKNVLDDEYVAILTGGFGNFSHSIGSNVYVIDWLTGKVKKEIKIEDKAYDDNSKNDIINSIPASPIVITADSSQANFSGALVYVNDLEGKITKINLTNMEQTPEYDLLTGKFTTNATPIKLYDKYTLFDVMASTQINNIYSYHSLDAGIGVRSKSFWLFGGTGDIMNLNDLQVDHNKVKNVMYGIKDFSYPFFGSAKTNQSPDNFLRCKNTTKDQDGSNCPDIGDRGWYINIDDQKKVVNEPTLTGNVVYYPVFKPLRGAKSCGDGKAYICSVDADCGTNLSKKLGTNEGAESNEECYYVGSGVLSKIVGFGTKLYANISGESTNKDKDDIVVIDAIDNGLINYRTSWRENY